jgi:hypothetical protein
VTCREVRDRLAEHAVGVLSRTDAREIDRHLESCPGCRKESAELLEGASAVAMSLPPAEPPARLEENILDRFRARSGRAPHPTGRTLRVLAAAALAAALLALSTTTWAVVQRKHVDSLQKLIQETTGRAQGLTRAINSAKENGKTFEADLMPPVGGRGNGTAAIFSAPRVNDLVFVDIVLPAEEKGPYIVQIVDGKKAINAGRLHQTVEGDWLMYAFSADDLSEALTVTVLNSSTGRMVLTGTVHPYAGS